MNADPTETSVQRLVAGDALAAEELFKRFSQQLIQQAYVKLHPAVRRVVDPEDVVQSVYRSFFGHIKNGNFQFDGWGGIWSLLIQMTIRKCCRDNRFHLAMRRDVTRDVCPDLSADSTRLGWIALDRQPQPAEVAYFSELIHNLCSTLKDPDHARILELKLQGYSHVEISEEVRVAIRTVERVVQRIRTWLEKYTD